MALCKPARAGSAALLLDQLISLTGAQTRGGRRRLQRGHRRNLHRRLFRAEQPAESRNAVPGGRPDCAFAELEGGIPDAQSACRALNRRISQRRSRMNQK